MRIALHYRCVSAQGKKGRLAYTSFERLTSLLVHRIVGITQTEMK